MCSSASISPFAGMRSARSGSTSACAARGQARCEPALCLALRRAGWRLIYDPAVAVDYYPAERLSTERREHPPPAALAHEVHNELYALLRWLPWSAKATGLA